jgi:quinolinate synthase
MMDFIREIEMLRKQKNAVILAHYYQSNDIQDIADYTGDSLFLSQQAAKTTADIIVFCGVHFMAETAKILSPGRKVVIPDINAGCSLANSCKADDFKLFLSKYPDHVVISYINTSAEIKALSDIICTSSNALEIVKSIPKERNIIFAPDKNLGNYIKQLTGREMIIWNGACHVHEEFSLEKIIEIKKNNPKAKLISHPECNKTILIISDYIGSTSALLKFVSTDKSDTYIIATEVGIIHQMKKRNPKKTFIPAPPKDSTCGCSECSFMKLNTIEKLYDCMKNEKPEIIIDEVLREKAEISLRRMLYESEKISL